VIDRSVNDRKLMATLTHDQFEMLKRKFCPYCVSELREHLQDGVWAHSIPGTDHSWQCRAGNFRDDRYRATEYSDHRHMVEGDI
jgi:hypothetical protein